MSGDPSLRVAIQRQVHAALTIDVTLDLGNELGVLTGPSGAGKTTLLRIIAGLERPDAGTVAAGGEVLTDRARGIDMPLRRRRIGYVFQHDVLFPHLDVAANLRYGLHGRPRREIETRVGEVVDLFGIGPLLGRRVDTLSGGERQRVGLARAIAPRPRLLLCDEPVSALDLDARYLLLTRLRAVRRIEQIPVLLVTHAVNEATQFGDRLWLLEAGRIVDQGNPEEVSNRRPAGGAIDRSGWQNVFGGVVAPRDRADRSPAIRLDGGPALIVSAAAGLPAGTRVFVRVGADEIVLAREPIGALSAQNLLTGTVERINQYGDDAEVAVRVGDLTWKVGIVAASIRSLELEVGAEVKLIIKARSCRPFRAGLES